MKYLRSTPTGEYYQMSDGRIGYINHQYARISVAREGFRNGEFYREDNKIGDRVYQINKKAFGTREYTMYNGEVKTFDCVERIKYKNMLESYKALKEYDEKNCSEIAMLNREKNAYKSRYKFYYDSDIKVKWQAERKYEDLVNNLSKLLINHG